MKRLTTSQLNNHITKLSDDIIAAERTLKIGVYRLIFFKIITVGSFVGLAVIFRLSYTSALPATIIGASWLACLLILVIAAALWADAHQNRIKTLRGITNKRRRIKTLQKRNQSFFKNGSRTSELG